MNKSQLPSLLRAIFQSLLVILIAVTPANAENAEARHEWAIATDSEVARIADSLAKLDANFRSGDYGNIDEFLLIKDRKIYAHFRYRNDYWRQFETTLQNDRKLTNQTTYDYSDSFPYNYAHPEWHPYYMGSELHTLQSISKSVVSILAGIAIDRKEISSVDVAVVDLLAGCYRIPNRDASWNMVTLEHLLTMRLNLNWRSDLPFDDPDNPDTGIEMSDDWVQYTLNLPMRGTPGTSFLYNSGATQLIGAILRESTGVDIEEYARRHLFKALAIDNFYWKQTPAGPSDALGGLYLKATDLAKIGQLMIDNGIWAGQRVVSSKWVEDSLYATTESAIESGDDRHGYGYQWWLPHDLFGERAFSGLGYGGQLLLGLPDQNVVVVLYGWNPEYEFPAPRKSFRPMLNEWLINEILARFESE
ncbi:MAG TPA: serine hydrolase [Woeseiaceae bacterium]|nr:serine hydrolase [Woeseiaceae bacterium]